MIPIIYTSRHTLHATDRIQTRNANYQTDEIPQRVDAILDSLVTSGIGIPAEPRDFGELPITAVHSLEMISTLKDASGAAGQNGLSDALFPEVYVIRYVPNQTSFPVARLGLYCHGTDSPILSGTWEAAYRSAQCALEGAQRLREGAQAVYALCRPPGHHASSDTFGGFCYVNNAAIAARFLQTTGKSSKLAILDIDYHHGNGTQEIFYSDPSVLYCSIHADPACEYPYFWGSTEEKGEGPGLGANANWPLPQSIDEEIYLHCLNEALERILDFQPEVLIVSFGQDIAAGDPVGGFCITVNGFARIGAAIAAIHLPALIVQEGGYRLDQIGECAAAFLSQFA